MKRIDTNGEGNPFRKCISNPIAIYPVQITNQNLTPNSWEFESEANCRSKICLLSDKKKNGKIKEFHRSLDNSEIIKGLIVVYKY